MAALGGIVTGGGNFVFDTLTLGALNVTGPDLALVCGAVEQGSADTTAAFTWDNGGNNEAVNGLFVQVQGFADYQDLIIVGLNDPTPANGTTLVSFGQSVDSHFAFSAFFTEAADLVLADSASTTASAGTSVQTTAPNVVAGDYAIDIIINGQNTSDPAPTETGQVLAAGSGVLDGFARAAVSTRAGSNGGAMGWSFPSAGYGVVHGVARIPDAGGGGPIPIEVSGSVTPLLPTGVGNVVERFDEAATVQPELPTGQAGVSGRFDTPADVTPENPASSVATQRARQLAAAVSPEIPTVSVTTSLFGASEVAASVLPESPGVTAAQDRLRSIAAAVQAELSGVSATIAVVAPVVPVAASVSPESPAATVDVSRVLFVFGSGIAVTSSEPTVAATADKAGTRQVAGSVQPISPAVSEGTEKVKAVAGDVVSEQASVGAPIARGRPLSGLVEALSPTVSGLVAEAGVVEVSGLVTAEQSSVLAAVSAYAAIADTAASTDDCSVCVRCDRG